MKYKLVSPKVGIVVFLLGAILFLAGYHILKSSSRGSVIERVASELHLSDQQIALFDSAHARLRAESSKLQGERTRLANELWAELMGDNRSVEIVRITDEWTNASRDLLVQRVTATSHFMSALDPEQQERLRSLLQDSNFIPSPN